MHMGREKMSGKDYIHLSVSIIECTIDGGKNMRKKVSTKPKLLMSFIPQFFTASVLSLILKVLHDAATALRHAFHRVCISLGVLFLKG